MSAFTTLARGPYYIAVAVFMGFAAFAAWIQHTMATGTDSDYFGAITLLTGGLAVWSAIFLFTAKSGEDDEARCS